MSLLRQSVRPLTAPGIRFFSRAVITGSHAASVRAVAQGEADLAAIDCVTWAHLQHLRPAETRNLRVLAWTAPNPGLPLITALGTDARTLAALRAALGEVTSAALLLEGFSIVPLAAYDVIESKAGLLF